MKVRVNLEIEVNGDTTFDEVEEFLEYCCAKNPFIDEDSDCDYVIEKFEIEEL